MCGPIGSFRWCPRLAKGHHNYDMAFSGVSAPDAQYTEPRLVALYDQLNTADHDYCFYECQIGPPPRRVLDLGCGTGVFARRLARAGHVVTGLDPAEEMIIWARSQDESRAVDWIVGTADDLPQDAVFDVVVMTGHAFQCLVTDTAVQGALRAVRSRLGTGGRFMFESRNPSFRAWETWTPEKETILQDATGAEVRVFTEIVEASENLVKFLNHFVFTDCEFKSESKLLFLSTAEIERHLRDAGFSDNDIYGDWDGPTEAEANREIIVIAHKKLS